MFGLPIGTALLLFGFPLFWVLYTVVFLIVTRGWGRDSAAEDGAEEHRQERRLGLVEVRSQVRHKATSVIEKREDLHP
ncbi:MAG: hypothetical protein ACE5KS_05790 [Woeseiaceae bacterium]